jgi:hypothetical protein
MLNSVARNLTPPGRVPQVSGTFPLEEEEKTSPINHNAILVAKVIHVMDHLSEDNKQLFLMFAEAFDNISDDNKKSLVTVAVNMAGL